MVEQSYPLSGDWKGREFFSFVLLDTFRVGLVDLDGGAEGGWKAHRS